MTLDEKIHLVLEKLNGSGPADLDRYIPEWLRTVNETADELEIHLIKYALNHEHLIVADQKNAGHIITHQGRIVNEAGGWKALTLSRKNRTDIENKTAENNLHISAFQIKTQWWPHRVSAAALLISIFSLIVSVQQCRQGHPDVGTDSSQLENQSAPTIQQKPDSLKTVPKDTSENL